MPQARKKTTRRSSEQEKYRAELTSSQLVIGVCVLMLFGLACFLIGVLVGKFDAGPVPEQVARVEPPVQARTVRLAPPEPKPSPVAVQQAPQIAPEPSLETTPRVPDEPEQPTIEEPKVIRLPEPGAPVETIVPVDAETPPAPTGTADASPQEPTNEPEAPPTLAAAPETTQTGSDSTPVRVEVLEPELERVSPAPTQPPVSASTRRPGQYTVQVGAFSQQANAEQARKRIEASTGYPVFLVDSPTGTLVKVHVGVFATESDAEAAKSELGEKLGYKESIIARHSIALTQAPSNSQ